MRKKSNALGFGYYATLAVSALTGLWHFFVPAMFRWYDYLPTQYENLIVGIEYTNYCFSLLLFGGSLLALYWGRRALGKSREGKEFYFFLTLVWLFRASLSTFIRPWPLDPIPAAAIGQLAASVCMAVGMTAVSAGLLKRLRAEQGAKTE